MYEMRDRPVPAMEVSMAKMTKQDRIWRAQDDAHTLASAEVIVKDIPRLKLAQKAAARMAEEKREQADAMGSIAKPGKKDPPSEKIKRKKKTGGSSGSVHNVFQKVGKK